MKRLRHGLLLLAALLTGVATQAQEGIHFGLRMMPMASFVMNQDDYDIGKALDIVPTFRVGVGLHGAYHFSDYAGVAASPWLGTWGQKYEGTPDTVLLEWDQRMSYLRVPLVIRVNTTPDAVAMFVLETGPEFGILTGVSTESATSVQDPYQVVKENFNSTDFSWVLRFGAGFNISDNIKLDFLIAANYGLSEIEAADYKATRIAGADRRITRNASPGVVIGLNYCLY